MAVNGDNGDVDERRLVEQCLSGNEPAWKTLLDRHYRTIAAVVRWQKWKFDHRDIEDTTQDALEELVKALAGFQFQSRLSLFIRTIAVRACVNRIRKKVAQKRISDSDCVPINSVGEDQNDTSFHTPLDPSTSQEEALLARERVSTLKGALSKLDRECKRLIRMRFFDDLSFPEIANMLKIKDNTIAVQVRRCVFKINRFFHEMD